jgi:anaerobic dimethyl sulfoxide reductase subunit C (anchor subunit)
MRLPSAAIGALTVACGIGGIVASARIYRVPSRPSWNTPFTMVEFHLTAAILGPLFVAAVGAGDARWLAVAVATTAGAQILILALRFLRFITADSVELRASATLLGTTLAARLVVRGALLALAAIALPLFTSHPAVLGAAFVLAAGSEVLGRYLFFVGAVPKHMAAPYLGSHAA